MIKKINQQSPRSNKIENAAKKRKRSCTCSSKQELKYQVSNSHTNFISNKVRVPVCLSLLVHTSSWYLTTMLRCWHQKAYHLLVQNCIVPITIVTGTGTDQLLVPCHKAINNLTGQNNLPTQSFPSLHFDLITVS